MNPFKISRLSAITVVTLFSTVISAMSSSTAQAQSAKDLVGSWRLVSTANTNAQGNKVEPFGPHPLGSYTFDATGHFTQVIVPGENGSTASVLAAFGDYTVTNDGKTLVRYILGSQDSSVVGEDLPVNFTLANDQMTVSNSSPSVNSSAHAESVWKRVR